MAKIYIFHHHLDEDIVDVLTDAFQQLGHSIIDENKHLGTDLSLETGLVWKANSWKKSDLILLLVTENSSESSDFWKEASLLKGYVEEGYAHKLLISMVFDDVKMPRPFRHLQAVPFTDTTDSIQLAAVSIAAAIDSVIEQENANKQEKAERVEKLERTSANYIDEAIDRLSKRERELQKKAVVWNRVGWGSLVAGVCVSFVMLIITLASMKDATINWSGFSYLALKSIVILALLIASSKYAYTLANSYMTESLKNSDRIHAISFGKFFLQAFGDNVDSTEVKEIFQHWNISNKSSFSDLNADKFDPKIIGAVLSVADVIKEKKGSKEKN